MKWLLGVNKLPNIQEQSYLYHLTASENLPSILLSGLLPRSQLSDFNDIADHEILESRSAHHLDSMVPFHFFAKNPFDGRVQSLYPTKQFVLIAISREFAENNSWSIIPKHPLSGDFKILSYQEGMEQIDWELMNTRDYHNPECKSVCMAECLSPTIVSPNNFSAIYVKSDEIKKVVFQLVKDAKLSCYVNVQPSMFL